MLPFTQDIFIMVKSQLSVPYYKVLFFATVTVSVNELIFIKILVPNMVGRFQRIS